MFEDVSPTEVGQGFPLPEEAGAAAQAGQLSGPNSGLFSNFFSGGGNTDWGKFFGKDGAGNSGIGALMMLLNANQQRRDANRPILSPGDEQNIVQEGTNSLSRSLSVQGNPAGSGHAQQELQNQATKTLARLRYEAALKRSLGLSQANNNMYGAGAFGLQALMRALTQGNSVSPTTNVQQPIGNAVY